MGEFEDMVRLNYRGGRHIDLPIVAFGLTWPPPEKLDFLGDAFTRTRMSSLTDAQIKEMDCVVRGAEYQQD